MDEFLQATVHGGGDDLISTSPARYFIVAARMNPFKAIPLTLLTTVLTDALNHHFTWGLLLGLLIAAFIWKAGFSARRNVARDLKRVEGELKNLQGHLNTQLKITASGNDSLQAELDSLRKQNEILRVNHAALQQKPGRAEQRLLQIQEIAIRAMREQAPGFASAWENALRQAEAEVNAAESGLTKLVRRVIPGLASPAQAARITTGDGQP